MPLPRYTGDTSKEFLAQFPCISRTGDVLSVCHHGTTYTLNLNKAVTIAGHGTLTYRGLRNGHMVCEIIPDGAQYPCENLIQAGQGVRLIHGALWRSDVATSEADDSLGIAA